MMSMKGDADVLDTNNIYVERRDQRWPEAYQTLLLSVISKTLSYLNENITPIPPLFELSIVLADDIFLRHLNKIYRNKDKPTNVLSFSGDYEDYKQVYVESLNYVKNGDKSGQTSNKASLLTPYDPSCVFINIGDIAVSYDMVLKEAEAQHKTMEDHTVHLTVHGVLHLLGYDHLESEDAYTMEKLEIRILKILGYNNPYETE